MMIAENVQELHRRIENACNRARRSPGEISLIAVTKTFSAPAVLEAVRAGISDIGENYVQELLVKHEELRAESVCWHFIGHLQSNKIRHVAPWIDLIHTIDSARLGEMVSAAAGRCGRIIDVMVEVNTSAETSKFGVRPGNTAALVSELARMPNLRTVGLMTIGPLSADPEDARASFRMLREIRESLQKSGFHLPHLSMGMTSDFEIAIEEGSTMIRVGTAIFGKRSKPVL